MCMTVYVFLCMTVYVSYHVTVCLFIFVCSSLLIRISSSLLFIFKVTFVSVFFSPFLIVPRQKVCPSFDKQNYSASGEFMTLNDVYVKQTKIYQECKKLIQTD